MFCCSFVTACILHQGFGPIVFTFDIQKYIKNQGGFFFRQFLGFFLSIHIQFLADVNKVVTCGPFFMSLNIQNKTALEGFT